MTHVTCRLTAKNRDQLQNPTLGNRVWATFFTYHGGMCNDVVPCYRVTVDTLTLQLSLVWWLLVWLLVLADDAFSALTLLVGLQQGIPACKH